MNSADLGYVCQLMREQSAIVLDQTKAYLVEGRLNPLAIAVGYATTAALIRHLRAAPLGPLHERVVEALATHETSFFRDPKVFRILDSQILSELLERKKKITIWSAACSTGQEPYSLAIALLERLPAEDKGSVRIFATDLCEQVLERARTGIYTRLELSRGLTPRLIENYFQAVGEHWQVRESVRSLVEFRRLNLAGAWPWTPWADLVLLRNVLIYFDDATRQAILDRIRRTMNPGGYLLLGSSETAIESEVFSRAILDGVITYRVSSSASSSSMSSSMSRIALVQTKP